jgi:hypothetical protein
VCTPRRPSDRRKAVELAAPVATTTTDAFDDLSESDALDDPDGRGDVVTGDPPR